MCLINRPGFVGQSSQTRSLYYRNSRTRSPMIVTSAYTSGIKIGIRIIIRFSHTYNISLCIGKQRIQYQIIRRTWTGSFQWTSNDIIRIIPKLISHFYTLHKAGIKINKVKTGSFSQKLRSFCHCLFQVQDVHLRATAATILTKRTKRFRNRQPAIAVRPENQSVTFRRIS